MRWAIDKKQEALSIICQGIAQISGEVMIFDCMCKGDKKECIEPNTKCCESKNGAKLVFKHIVIHPHIQTAEVSILDGIKMEDFV